VAVASTPAGAPARAGPGAPRRPTADRPSPATLQLVDGEVRRIVDDCYAAELDLLRANRERLDHLAHTLLDHGALDEADAYRAAGFPAPTAPIRNLDTTPVDR
jgi:cell division protease FtsH